MSECMVDVVKLCRWWKKELDPIPPEIAAKLLFLCIKYEGWQVSTLADKTPNDILAALRLCEKCWFERHPAGGVLHFHSGKKRC